MIILGIDPGLKHLGWGVIEAQTSQRMRHIAHGVITTDASFSMPERLFSIYQDLIKLFDKYTPKALANEALIFSKNVSSALPVAHVRGIILLLAMQQNVAIKSFAPNTIKQAVTGNGMAKKGEVQQMVKLLLKLEEIPKPDHAADALAIAISYAYGVPAVSDRLT